MPRRQQVCPSPPHQWWWVISGPHKPISVLSVWPMRCLVHCCSCTVLPDSSLVLRMVIHVADFNIVAYWDRGPLMVYLLTLAAHITAMHSYNWQLVTGSPCFNATQEITTLFELFQCSFTEKKLPPWADVYERVPTGQFRHSSIALFLECKRLHFLLK